MAIGVQTDMATPALARFGSDELWWGGWRVCGECDGKKRSGECREKRKGKEYEMGKGTAQDSGGERMKIHKRKGGRK